MKINPVTFKLLVFKTAIVIALGFTFYMWHGYVLKREVIKAENVIIQQYIVEKEVLKKKAWETTNALLFTISQQQKDRDAEIKAINSKYSNIVSGLQQRPSRATGSICVSEAPGDGKSGSGATGLQLFREDAVAFTRVARDTAELQARLKQCYLQYDTSKDVQDKFQEQYKN